MKKIHYILFLFCLLSATGYVYPQVTIGTEDDPHRDAVLDLKSADNNKGLLLPRLNLVDVNEPEPMKRHVAGMVVYNLGENNVPAGYYYNDGYQWVQIFDSQVSAWRNIETQEAAKSNTDDIYQNAVVVTGASEIDPKTQFAVVSTTMGALLPRLTQTQVDAVREAEPADVIPDGLFVYNVSTKCFNYFEEDLDKWLSLCADEEPAVFELADCDQANYYPQTPGAYIQSSQLTDIHYYKIQVRVTKKGKYSIRLNTANNYSFEKSGTFTEVGIYDIILQGQGIPLYPSLGDELIVLLNGKNVTADLPCELPKVPVAAADVVYEVQCNSGSAGTVNGEYIVNVSAEDRANNYIDITVTVSASGNTNIVTNEVNGMVFRSDAVYLDQLLPSQTVRLYAYGTPLDAGIIQFTLPRSSCPFDATVINPLGTFRNPAKSCLEILTEDPTKEDGEYWIKQSANSNNPVKTLCDMTNGGYTLLLSYSEKTAYEVYSPSGMRVTGRQLSADITSNVVTTETGTINYADYRISSNTMKSAAASTNNYMLKVRICENPTNMTDEWGQNNYGILSISAGIRNPLQTDFGASLTARIPTEGKLWGRRWQTVTSGGGSYGGMVENESGVMVNRAYIAFYNNPTYSNHWDWGVPGSGTLFEVIPNKGGRNNTQTLNSSNNMFGYFGEEQPNHHFGKCGDGSDDYSFDSKTCGTASLRPHSFNNGQGRYLQWWVK